MPSVLVYGIVGLLLARLSLNLIPWAQKLAVDSLVDPELEPYLVIPALLILGVGRLAVRHLRPGAARATAYLDLLGL